MEDTIIDVIDPTIDKLYEIKKILNKAGVDWEASVGTNLRYIRFKIKAEPSVEDVIGYGGEI